VEINNDVSDTLYVDRESAVHETNKLILHRQDGCSVNWNISLLLFLSIKMGNFCIVPVM